MANGPLKKIAERDGSVARHLMRYGMVGLTQNGFFYLVSLWLIGMGWKAWLTILVLYPCGVALSFLGNRYWSFRDRAPASGTAGKYLLVYIAAYPISTGTAWLLQTVGLRAWLAMTITMLLTALLIFAALRSWVFRPPGPQPD